MRVAAALAAALALTPAAYCGRGDVAPDCPTVADLQADGVTWPALDYSGGYWSHRGRIIAYAPTEDSAPVPACEWWQA